MNDKDYKKRRDLIFRHFETMKDMLKHDGFICHGLMGEVLDLLRSNVPKEDKALRYFCDFECPATQDYYNKMIKFYEDRIEVNSKSDYEERMKDKLCIYILTEYKEGCLRIDYDKIYARLKTQN